MSMFLSLSRLASKLQSSNNAALIQRRRFATGPYLTVGRMVREVFEDGGITGGIQLFDPAKEILVVFSEEETTEGKYMCYTEDIGDLCIFLSDSHPFCVEASSCPGLKPNSIYHMSPEGFGVYNLATRTSRDFEPPKDGPISVAFQPYWLPPSCI